jgi:hypothetical protein
MMERTDFIAQQSIVMDVGGDHGHDYPLAPRKEAPAEIAWNFI